MLASTLAVALICAPASFALPPSASEVAVPATPNPPHVPTPPPVVPPPFVAPTVTVPTDPPGLPEEPETPEATVDVELLPDEPGDSGGSSGAGPTGRSGAAPSSGSTFGSGQAVPFLGGGSAGVSTDNSPPAPARSSRRRAGDGGGAEEKVARAPGSFVLIRSGAGRGKGGTRSTGTIDAIATARTPAGVTPLATLLAGQPIPAGASGVGDVRYGIAAIVAALLIVLFVGWVRSVLLGARARRLEREGKRLMSDKEALQSVLVPDVPANLGALAASVAYKPASGLGAGGDFYDAWALEDGRVAMVVGDVSGHDRGAIGRAASARYTVRAYLKAGLEPSKALEAAGRSLDNEWLDGSFATAVLAVHDPAAATLTYACAGHPPPILIGPGAHEPVTAAAAPPLGWGVHTGVRQTTVSMPAGSVACLFTDGLIEARVGGEMLGRERLAKLVAETAGEKEPAEALLDRLEHATDESSDDVAAFVVRAESGAPSALVRIEELQLEAEDLTGARAERFLEACGLDGPDLEVALEELRAIARPGVAMGLRIGVDDSGHLAVAAAAAVPEPAENGAARRAPAIA